MIRDLEWKCTYRHHNEDPTFGIYVHTLINKKTNRTYGEVKHHPESNRITVDVVGGRPELVQTVEQAKDFVFRKALENG